ncbi:glycosyltransferase [Algoriphagus aestuariicola]|uniref:Glycosyltransferase n=1 Tax=Algoriphagus aestuariicola TaxID=1852016 RepID=A0ABS3BMP7_9BACT|nr:glycosyltransferase [Algoriphagus aestuariicola]MBN7800191.1 glycosyltransferase [Algoriphagus aestuariicola]
MKIIRLCTLLDFGGLEQRLATISKVDDSNEWVFCALGTGGDAAKQIEKNGKRVVLLETSYTIPSLQAIFELLRFFKNERPDMVHTSGAEANFHGIIAAKITGVKKLISEEIGIPNQKFFHRFAFRLLYKFPSHILGNAFPVGKYLSEVNGVPSDKLKIIPNPVDFSSIKDIERSESSEFHILTVSRLKAVKNIEGVLRVIACLKKDGKAVRFTVVGEGDHFPVLRNLVNELDLKEQVDFKGYLPKPFSVIECADIFVLNSFTEGFSNALAEAMAAGIPSLAADVGAARDLITESETGWLVSAGDDDGLYGKLNFIMSLEKSRRENVGKTGRISIREKFSLERHMDQLMELYHN